MGGDSQSRAREYESQQLVQDGHFHIYLSEKLYYLMEKIENKREVRVDPFLKGIDKMCEILIFQGTFFYFELMPEMRKKLCTMQTLTLGGPWRLLSREHFCTRQSFDYHCDSHSKIKFSTAQLNRHYGKLR